MTESRSTADSDPQSRIVSRTIYQMFMAAVTLLALAIMVTKVIWIRFYGH